MTGKGKPRRCRICRKRPAWTGKNCPPGVCKRCYHKHIWADRPATRGQRRAGTDGPDRSWIDEPFDTDEW